MVYDHGTGYAPDALLQPALKRHGRIAAHLLGGNLVGEGVRAHRAHDYFARSKAAHGRMIAIVPIVRGDEDKRQYQRHHHVIVEAAALIRPENVALQNTAHKIAGPSTSLRSG